MTLEDMKLALAAAEKELETLRKEAALLDWIISTKSYVGHNQIWYLGWTARRGEGMYPMEFGPGQAVSTAREALELAMQLSTGESNGRTKPEDAGLQKRVCAGSCVTCAEKGPGGTQCSTKDRGEESR